MLKLSFYLFWFFIWVNTLFNFFSCLFWLCIIDWSEITIGITWVSHDKSSCSCFRMSRKWLRFFYEEVLDYLYICSSSQCFAEGKDVFLNPSHSQILQVHSSAIENFGYMLSHQLCCSVEVQWCTLYLQQIICIGWHVSFY